MVRTILLSRAGLYATPELEQWSKNSGCRINQKIQQLLKKFGASIPGAAEVVAEETAALTGTKKSSTPTKPKMTTPKKRKVVKDEDDLDDY
jgi:hypothetical protein